VQKAQNLADILQISKPEPIKTGCSNAESAQTDEHQFDLADKKGAPKRPLFVA
jgi:hypothetical protein